MRSEKGWLQTNFDMHIEHVKKSGCVEDIRLAKLWKRKVGLQVRTFPLELLVVKLLKSSRIVGLDRRFRYFLGELLNSKEAISVEDPANADNDVGKTLEEQWNAIHLAAGSSLLTADRSGWAAVFGTGTPVRKDARAVALNVSIQRGSGNRPWRRDK